MDSVLVVKISDVPEKLLPTLEQFAKQFTEELPTRLSIGDTSYKLLRGSEYEKLSKRKPSAPKPISRSEES